MVWWVLLTKHGKVIGLSDPKSYVEQSDMEEISLELIVAATEETFLGETEIAETCKEAERRFWWRASLWRDLRDTLDKMKPMPSKWTSGKIENIL